MGDSPRLSSVVGYGSPRPHNLSQPRCFAASAFARLLVFAVLDHQQRVINNLDWRQARKTVARWPNAMSALNRYRKDRRPGFQSHADGTGLKLFHRAVRVTAAALRKDHYRAAFPQPLHGTPDGRGIAALQL